jgi:hydroxymethylpyrimidine pyrophosphatase-like HAD family hydrolase
MMSKIALCDFDGTITHFSYPEMGEPQEGVKEALQEIRNKGYEIHIFSCRTNHELQKFPIDRSQQVRKMESYLDKHEIPYDVVLNENKPLCNLYIGDEAIGFRGDWKKVLEEMEKR